jgi:hypothetical protein
VNYSGTRDLDLTVRIKRRGPAHLARAPVRFAGERRLSEGSSASFQGLPELAEE